MVTRIDAPESVQRLSIGWWVLAVAVTASLIVAEYWGPIIGIAFTIASCGLGMLWGAGSVAMRFPDAGYWLVAILGLGLVSGIWANVAGAVPLDIDVQRDVGMALSYLLFLVVGFCFAHSRETFRLLLAAIILAGLLISVIHLIKLTTVVSSGVTDLYLFRLEAGRGSITQFAGLCACLLLLAEHAERRLRRLVTGCAVLTLVSMLLTLSRGLMLVLIVLALVMVGVVIDRFGRLTIDLVRFVIAIAATAAVVVSAYLVIAELLPAVHQFIDEFFITRVVNSVNEVSAQGLQTRTQIANNYRAFELDRAMAQFREIPLPAQLAGQGFGSSVTFGFETASTKVAFSRTEASFLHNGYAYYLMKAGVLGLLLYVGFMAHLVYRAVKRSLWPADTLASIQRKVLLTLVLSLAIGTVTTGGFGYPATYLAMAALIGLCYGPLQSTEPGRVPDA